MEGMEEVMGRERGRGREQNMEKGSLNSCGHTIEAGKVLWYPTTPPSRGTRSGHTCMGTWEWVK